MAKYKVDVVVTGIATVDVEAADGQDAKDTALEVVDHISFGSLSKINTHIGCVEDENHRDVTAQRLSWGKNRRKGYAPHYVNYGEEAF